MSDRGQHFEPNTRDKVLVVAPTPPPYGGMALQAALLARLLVRDGVEAEVLGYNQAFRPSFRFLEDIPGLRTCLRATLHALRLWRRAAQCSVVHIFACSWLYFFLVVCPAVVLSRLRGARVVLNYRGGDAEPFLARFGWLARPVFQAADVVTAPSAFLAGVIQRRLSIPVSIVPNIVDFSAFSFHARTKFQPTMLVTRHFEALYGIETVLRAFRIISKNYPSARLWLAGTGRQEGYLRSLVSEWNLANVQFLGYLDRAMLPKVYEQCDILLNGSRVDNFPASLVEASAAGLAVVSSNVGGIPFIYEHEKTALLTNVDDWRGLASAVERLLEEPDLGVRLARSALHVAQKCDWSNVRRDLYASYGFTQVKQQFKSIATLVAEAEN